MTFFRVARDAVLGDAGTGPRRATISSKLPQPRRPIASPISSRRLEGKFDRF